MKDDLLIKNSIIIPGHELEITASRAGGPGGQHVNKTSTRITVRWKVKETRALTAPQKERVLNKLQAELTAEGELLVSNSASRSQQQNKKAALAQLADKVRNALRTPKKRLKSKIPKAAKEKRLQKKKKHGALKHMRRKKIDIE